MKASRQIFAELISAEAGLEVRSRFGPSSLRAALFGHRGGVDREAESEIIARMRKPAAANSDLCYLAGARSRFIALADAAGATESASALECKAALETAPLFIATQHLLHAVCGNWNNEDGYALTALRAHAIDVGWGQPRAGRIDRYREMLRSLGAGDVGADLAHSAADPRISEGAFALASKLMLLGCFPQSFAGEILGANLFFRTCGLLPPLELIRRSEEASLFLDLGRHPVSGAGVAAELSMQAIHEYAGAEGPRLFAVAAGYDWARRSTDQLCARALDVLTRWIDPREAAIELLHRRRHDALQYHATTTINGQKMCDLLAEEDAAGFLDQLALSEFVRAGEPENSPLVNGLISPRSKMFRIFSDDEIAVLRRWIKGLPYKAPSIRPPAFQAWEDDEPLSLDAYDRDAASAEEFRAKPRQMYSQLLRTEVSRRADAYARDYAAKWLKRSADAVVAGDCPLPETWRRGQLQAWLQEKHDVSNDLLSGSQEEIPQRDDVVANVCSLAPLTMIDGAWLAGFAHPSLASSDGGWSLFATYFDELGNGMQELNHPTIYRELMQHVCGALPPTHDAAYAEQAFFGDKDFDLPVFWLAIGRYPLTYRQEILGLNLAMELSGVGGGYRQTGRALAAHDFPTMFVSIHNSIDNISTGHTAWAASSIDTFMSGLSRSDYETSWLRVRTGFVALNPPSRNSVAAKIKDRLKSFL